MNHVLFTICTISFIFSLILTCNSLPITSNLDQINDLQKETLLELKRSSATTTLKCELCHFTVGTLQILLGSKLSRGCMAALAEWVCEKLHIMDNHVCKAVTSEYKDEFLYVFTKLIFKPREICAVLLPNDCEFPTPSKPWLTKLPGNKPPVKPWSLPKKGAKKLRVLQLADIHFDQRYVPGFEAECSEPLCCRHPNPPHTTVKRPAEFWGMRGKCDIPTWTLENMFRHLATKEKFDYILWTGDLPPHNVWNQTRADQVSRLHILGRWFLQFFPDTPIFSAVGNHESAPADSFPFPSQFIPSEYSISWLYDTLAEEWTRWLPKSSESTIKRSASYSVRPYPGFKLISLNTQYGDKMNFWLYLNQTDPGGTLAWLVTELEESERKGETVHIIGHIPPREALQQWSYNYYRVVNRFESTIRAQFFGHTHNDHFSVFYANSSSEQRPTNFYFSAPSVTTFPGLLPSYRVYTIDGNHSQATWTVLDHENYFFDLEQANENNKTEWKLAYKAKDEYSLKSLFPNDWSNLILKFKENETLFETYVKHFYTALDDAPDCDWSCKFNQLCRLRSARSNDHRELCADLGTPDAPSRTELENAASDGKAQMDKILEDITSSNDIFDICREKLHYD